MQSRSRGRSSNPPGVHTEYCDPALKLNWPGRPADQAELLELQCCTRTGLVLQGMQLVLCLWRVEINSETAGTP